MTEPKTPKQARAPKPEPAAPVLADAGASTSPVVHQVLAELSSAVLNEDAEGVLVAEEKLAALGVR